MENFEPQIKLEHADARGEIYSITLPGDKELMLLHSKAGSLRGGHAHDCDEMVLLLKGIMTYYKRSEDGKESAEIGRDGMYSFNPAGLYHMGEFLEDSWLLEWKINTQKGAWKNIDYKPYRDKVNAAISG